MSYETGEKAIKSFINLMKKYLPPQLHETHISIYGGETLLNRPVLYKLIDKFGTNYKGVKLDWIVNTNGSLLNKKDLDVFSKANVDIHISLDGNEKTHNKTRVDKQGRGTFKRVIKAIDLCKENNYNRIQIDTVADPLKMSSVDEVIDIAKKKGISRIHLDLLYSPKYPKDFSPEDYATSYASAYLKAAKVNIQAFASPFSQIYSNFANNRVIESACSSFPSLEVFADGSFIFGELPLIKPFGKLDSLENEQTWEKRTSLLAETEKEMKDKCKDCFLFPHCQGGMRRINRYHTLATKNEDNICTVSCRAMKVLEDNKFKLPDAE